MLLNSRQLAPWSAPCILLVAACDASDNSIPYDRTSKDASVLSDSAATATEKYAASSAEFANAASESAASGETSVPGARLFDASRVASLTIEVTRSDLALLRKDAEQPMGFEKFTYVPARLTYDDMVLDQVGIRVKGNSSRASASGDAVPFKIDANRYVEGQKIDGETKLNLHNGANQPTLMNEYLSYGALRDFGIPASRTGWVDVTLNGISLGTYVTVEQVGNKLLSRYYDKGDADLYKPEPPTGYLTYSGDEFSDYGTANYESQNETDHATFLKLVRTIAQSDVDEWDEVIDVGSVLDYFAANVALGNWDTYVAMGHNYYLFEATPGRMVMLPWDMNLSQGATSAVCPIDVQAQGSLPGLGGMGPMAIPSGGGFPGGEGAPPLGLDGGAFVPPDGVPFGVADGGFLGGARSGAPLHDKLLSDAQFLVRYLARLEGFLDGPGSVATLDERIELGRAALGDRITEASVKSLRQSISERVTNIKSSIPNTTSCGMAAGSAGGIPTQ